MLLRQILRAALIFLEVILGILALDGLMGGAPGPEGLALGLLVVAMLVGGIALRWLAGKDRDAERSHLRPWRIAFVLIASACGLGLAFLQPFQIDQAFVSFLVAFVIFLGLTVVWSGALDRPAPPVSRGTGALEFLLFTSLLVAVGVELGLRVLARRSPSPLLLRADAGVDQQIAAYRFRPGQVNLGFPCNSSGDYDEEPVDGPTRPWTVLAVGDSFSASTVPHPYHFTTVCEELLEDVEVYNRGVSHAGPREYRRLIETHPLDAPPDAVLICLFVGNDVSDSGRGRSSFPWLRSWLQRENVLLLTLPGRLSSAQRDPLQRGPAMEMELDGDRVRIRTEHGELDGTRAQLAGFLPRLFPWLDDPSLAEPTFSEDEFLEIETERARIACGPDDGAYGAFRETMEELLESCEGTPTAVLLIPDQFQVDDDLWAALVERVDANLVRDRPQTFLAEFLAAREVPVLDLLPALRAAKRDDPDRPLYLPRDTHFNAHGYRIAGEELARFLEATWPR